MRRPASCWWPLAGMCRPSAPAQQFLKDGASSSPARRPDDQKTPGPAPHGDLGGRGPGNAGSSAPVHGPCPNKHPPFSYSPLIWNKKHLHPFIPYQMGIKSNCFD